MDRATASHLSTGTFAEQVATKGLQEVRVAWCDLHGALRTKSLSPAAALSAMDKGIGMVSTLALKDTSDRTAFKVFEREGTQGMQGVAFASNFMLHPDTSTFRKLPWLEDTGWMQGDLRTQQGEPVAFDTRHILKEAIGRLAQHGLGMRCGLEVEFHVYRIKDRRQQLDPLRAGWPGEPPEVEMVHPGYNMLSETWHDMAQEPLRIVRTVALQLGLPLMSLEVEFGPSQLEAVFDVTDALNTADNMVLFRSAVKQALLRAGYHATFMCRPPFPQIMSSGWHLHQSLVHLATGENAFMRNDIAEVPEGDARRTLSDKGAHYMAGLLAHAHGMAPFCAPTINAYGRYQPNALAPLAPVWGRDNRGAMLRVIGGAGDKATRIENRIGEPLANPYLYLASQIHAGLDGIERQLSSPPETTDPYASEVGKLPIELEAALEALQADTCLVERFGQDFISYFVAIKQFELQRFREAVDPDAFFAREYFGRY